MRNVSTIAALDMRRLGRDRLALFFIFVLPFVLITVIGSLNSGGELDASVVVIDRDGGATAEQLTGALAEVEGIELLGDQALGTAERNLRTGQLGGIVVIPDGFADDLAAGDATVSVTTSPTGRASALVDAAVSDAIDQVGRELTVQRVLERSGVDEPADRAARAVAEVGGSGVRTQVVGSGSELSAFAWAAGGQMILFMFVNALAAASMFIEMRRLGVLERIRSGPVASSEVIFGLALSRFLLACTLAGLILAFSSLIYDVSWGSPVVVASVVVLFGLVSAAASSLIGSLFDEPDAAVSVGIPVGLGMAALGGCMFPLFLAPTGMQVAAKVLTPHAWAVTALMDSSFEGAGFTELWPNLVVLALWAAVLAVAAGSVSRRFGR